MSNVKGHRRKLPWYVMIIIFSGVVGGLTVCALGMVNVQNYYHSILFVCITSGLGIFTGICLGRKYKHILTARPGSDFFGIVFILCMFFSAIILFLASVLNKHISKEEIVFNSVVLYKYHKGAQGRAGEINYVILNIKGEEHKLNCSYDYEIWARLGQKLGVYVYKSPL